MKTIYFICAVLTLSIATSAFAAGEFIPFTSIEEAQKNCPAINGLTFTSNNPGIPNSKGSIAGNNRIPFESFPAKQSQQPKNMDSNGLIKDAQFRGVDGIYGYISNNVITCLYSYTGFTDGQIGLVVRGK